MLRRTTMCGQVVDVGHRPRIGRMQSFTRPSVESRSEPRPRGCYSLSVLSSPQMSCSAKEHIGPTALERYSLEDLGTDDLETVECHLLICVACRDRLEGIEPLNTIHYTLEGPFYSRITQLRDGSFRARHWGCQIDGGDNYRGLAGARKYLLDSFVQMFPEHECGEACHAHGTDGQTGDPILSGQGAR